MIASLKTHIAANNGIILGILDDLGDVFDGTIDIDAGASDKDDILIRCIANFSAKLDRERRVLTDDAGTCSLTCSSCVRRTHAFKVVPP
jgi:hypothetical protein